MTTISQNFGDLDVTDESKYLINIYFGKQQCEKNSYGKPERMPENVAVLGAGLMAAGVATVSFIYIVFIMLFKFKIY